MLVEGRDDMDEPVYSILEVNDGVGTFFLGLGSKEKAERIMSALKWQDSIGDGLMSLAQEGVTFDTNTGKVWTPPKRRRVPSLKIAKGKK
jgi:hypothetical protein